VRKLTKIQRLKFYLNARSQLHSTNKHSILSNWTQWDKIICLSESLQTELNMVKNSYRWRSSKPPKLKVRPPRDHPTKMAFLSFIQNIFNHISKALTKSNTETVKVPAQKVSALLHPLKKIHCPDTAWMSPQIGNYLYSTSHINWCRQYSVISPHSHIDSSLHAGLSGSVWTKILRHFQLVLAGKWHINKPFSSCRGGSVFGWHGCYGRATSRRCFSFSWRHISGDCRIVIKGSMRTEVLFTKIAWRIQGFRSRQSFG